MVNITNRCTLRCKHCFVYREDNPNTPNKQEMDTKTMIRQLRKYRKKYGILSMVWMGGEPLLRKDVLEQGIKLFWRNVVTTNGTIPLINLGAKVKWVISLDGPEEINDEIRGKGSFKKVMKTLQNLPDDFTGDLQCQCCVTKLNEDNFDQLINELQETPIRGMTFSFYVPKKMDNTGLAWKTLEERDPIVKKAHALKRKYPKFILNRERSFELLLSQNSLNVTNNCPLKKYMLPLYLGNQGFESPFCCYGNDVNCDLCGAWGVFHMATLLEEIPRFQEGLMNLNI